MNTLTNDKVNSVLNELADNVDYKAIYIDGCGDSSDVLALSFLGNVYADGYSCRININIDFSSGFWVADVNGYNAMNKIKNETELKFAIRHLMQYSRFPCTEQKLDEQKEDSNSDENYYD